MKKPKQKKKRQQEKLSTIALVTAVLTLIAEIIDLITKLLR